MCRAILDYPTGQRWSNPWQALDFRRRRRFQIDRFAGRLVGADAPARRRCALHASRLRRPRSARFVAPVTRRRADSPRLADASPPLRRNSPHGGRFRSDRRATHRVRGRFPSPRPRHPPASSRAVTGRLLRGPTAAGRRLFPPPLPPPLPSSLPPRPLHLRELRVERHPPTRLVPTRRLIPPQPAPPDAEEDHQREEQRRAIGRGLSHAPRLPAPGASPRIIRLPIVSKARRELRHRCTSAHATSPTIFNDPAEILSIVSSGV